MHRYQIKNIFAVFISSLMLTACVSTSASLKKSLFERLGGLPVLTTLTDKTIDKHVNHPSTQRTFKHIKLPPLKKNVVSFLCNKTGGPCKYEGSPLPKAHHGLNITPEEFKNAAQQLSETMDELKIGQQEKDELLNLLGSLQHEVVAH